MTVSEKGPEDKMWGDGIHESLSPISLYQRSVPLYVIDGSNIEVWSISMSTYILSRPLLTTADQG